MKETGRVSTLMLERYRLGEVSAMERKLVETELSSNGALRVRYEALESQDRELRQRYPWEQSSLKNTSVAADFRSAAEPHASDSGRMSRFPTGKRLWALCAAAILLLAIFPSVYLLRGRLFGGRGPDGRALGEISGVIGTGTDRLKGMEIDAELSIYLKENPSLAADEGRKLPDSTLLREGNTVQLAYLTPPGDVYYGVIFSIDGRSVVTLHYPYRRQQSPILTAGRRTFLEEAYTLDDAPDFELFFMVVSQDPLNTEVVLKTAEELAKEPETALAKSAAVFAGCDVETITIRK
jgi:hypothetical protein